MPEKTTLKIGAVGAILGAILVQAAGIIHPVETATIFNTAVHMKEVAENAKWVTDYYLFVIGFLFLLAGFIGIYKSISDQPAASWAKLAMSAGAISVTIALLFFMLDGFAVKVIANAVMAEGGNAFIPAAAVIDKLGRVFYGLWTFMAFGVTPLLFGVSVWKSSAFKKWLGILPILSGLAGFITGSMILTQDFSLNLLPGFYIAVLVFNIWMVITGILMWKKASAMSI